MSTHDREQKLKNEHMLDEVALVLPLTTLDQTLLSVVGGKAANLGELIRAGFSVPEGTKAGHGQPPDQGGGGGIRRGFVPEDREIGVGRPYRRSTLISSSTDGAPSGRPSPSR